MFMFVLLLRTFIGMFGAVEDSQEEAVRFFEAWKAEVARFHEASPQICKNNLSGRICDNNLMWAGYQGGAGRQAARVASKAGLGTSLQGARVSTT